ncbi:MAG: right-handed parallel beta-helix repeat-containing protein, partial [Planctomycetes bacterium]|nr:right-handed parallel beta-helix repeat-containing protein [Planctomycetota bacterium]
MFKPRCTVAVVCATLSGTAVADTLYVNCSCGDDAWSGVDPNCVPADGPKKTIQAAIDAAANGDEIVVAPGTCNETIDFLGKAITVRSTDPNDPGVVATTIIDGTGLNDSVVKCISGEGAATVLDGFTITGGTGTLVEFLPGNFQAFGGGMFNESNSSPTVANCIFSGNPVGFRGGGMANFNNSNPTVTNSTFSQNTAFDGGGMYNVNSNPTVTECTFVGNSLGLNGGVSNNGGGMRNEFSNPFITDCAFIGNTVTGFPFAAGGAMANFSSNPMVMDTTFTGNTTTSSSTAGEPGGGAMINFNSSPTLTNCTFSENSAVTDGGAIANFASSNPTVANCTFSDNLADYGGGMYNSVSSDPTVTNCSFSGNTATFNGGGISNYFASHPTVTNCILWGDSPNEIVDVAGAVTTVNYSCVQGGWFGAGANNIDADPMFVDPGSGD